jgi:hypothetical protein
MKRTKLIGGTVAVALVAGGVTGGVLGAVGGDDNERPITGPALEDATRAALEATGGGRVTETEAGDEEGAYEVEVTLDSGRQVDVHLDINFNVLSIEGDLESPDDDD